MLPLQSVSVTSSVFMASGACLRTVIYIKVLPLRLSLTRKQHLPLREFRCAAAASVKMRDSHVEFIIFTSVIVIVCFSVFFSPSILVLN